MLKFETYFTKFWMVQKTPQAFSIFGLKHKTNNHAESFHSSMSRFMSNHPAFWKFCDDLVQHVLLVSPAKTTRSKMPPPFIIPSPYLSSATNPCPTRYLPSGPTAPLQDQSHSLPVTHQPKTQHL